MIFARCWRDDVSDSVDDDDGTDHQAVWEFLTR